MSQRMRGLTLNAVSTQWEDAGLLRTLHQRVLSGDATAGDELSTSMLGVLRRRLRRSFQRVDWDAIEEAAEDGILEYLTRPQRFDASLGVPLEPYLYTIAWRRLANHTRNTAVSRAREAAHRPLPPEMPAAQVDQSHVTDLRRRVMAIATNVQERLALGHWIDGDDNLAIASALGVSHLPEGEQRREIKRFKDRLRRRLHRNRRASEDVADPEIPAALFY